MLEYYVFLDKDDSPILKNAGLRHMHDTETKLGEVLYTPRGS